MRSWCSFTSARNLRHYSQMIMVLLAPLASRTLDSGASPPVAGSCRSAPEGYLNHAVMTEHGARFGKSALTESRMSMKGIEWQRAAYWEDPPWQD